MGAEQTVEMVRFFIATMVVMYAIEQICQSILLITKMPNGRSTEKGYIIAKTFAFLASFAVSIILVTYAARL